MLTILSSMATFSFALFVLPKLITFFTKHQIGDPLDHRRLHHKFIPTSGGLAIFLPTLISISFFCFFMENSEIWIITLCIFMVSLVGLYDDFSNVGAVFKLMTTCIPTIILISFTDLRIESFHGLFGFTELSIFPSYFLTFLVILFLTNAFNLIDGVDGLLSSISSFILLIFGTWFLLIGEFSYSLISFALLGGILGFLVYNWHPAKIFMGDSGSLAIGFSISVLAIAFLQRNETIHINSLYKINAPISLVISLLVLPIFDTLRVFVIRILNKQSPFSPDKRHIHHYLYNLNFGHRKISLSLLYFNMSMFLLILMLNGLSDSILVSGIALFFVSLSIGMFLYHKLESRSQNADVIQNSRYKVNS